jgi:hypothetical protein
MRKRLSPDSMGAITITKIQESLQNKQNMSRLNIHEYLAKHKAEFPGSKIHHELPMPTNAISIVSDPENWHCYPQDVVCDRYLCYSTNPPSTTANLIAKISPTLFDYKLLWQGHYPSTRAK